MSELETWNFLAASIAICKHQDLYPQRFIAWCSYVQAERDTQAGLYLNILAKIDLDAPESATVTRATR